MARGGGGDAHALSGETAAAVVGREGRAGCPSPCAPGPRTRWTSAVPGPAQRGPGGWRVRVGKVPRNNSSQTPTIRLAEAPLATPTCTAGRAPGVSCRAGQRRGTQQAWEAAAASRGWSAAPSPQTQAHHTHNTPLGSSALATLDLARPARRIQCFPLGWGRCWACCAGALQNSWRMGGVQLLQHAWHR